MYVAAKLEHMYGTVLLYRKQSVNSCGKLVFKISQSKYSSDVGQYYDVQDV